MYRSIFLTQRTQRKDTKNTEMLNWIRKKKDIIIYEEDDLDMVGVGCWWGKFSGSGN
jgi:hypothetical protein